MRNSYILLWWLYKRAVERRPVWELGRVGCKAQFESGLFLLAGLPGASDRISQSFQGLLTKAYEMAIIIISSLIDHHDESNNIGKIPGT